MSPLRAEERLGALWLAAIGGWTLAVCVLAARGAERPLLAALGSLAWIAVGGGLALLYARGLAGLASPDAPRVQRGWARGAPLLAAALTAAGCVWQAARVPEAPWLVLAGLAVAVLGASAAGVGRAGRDARRLRRLLLAPGLLATALGLAAPLRLWLLGTSVEAVSENVIAFAFGTIPGVWCAGAWLLGARRVGGDPATGAQ